MRIRFGEELSWAAIGHPTEKVGWVATVIGVAWSAARQDHIKQWRFAWNKHHVKVHGEARAGVGLVGCLIHVTTKHSGTALLAEPHRRFNSLPPRHSNH